MINRKLLVHILMRLMRKKDALTIWVVRHPDEIRYRVDILAFEGFKFEYKPAQRMAYLPNNNRIKFVIEDDNADRLAGLLVDEVIVDEA